MPGTSSNHAPEMKQPDQPITCAASSKPFAAADSEIRLESSGAWIQIEELKNIALQALSQNQDIVFNLSGLSHLDAGALQILLCVQKQQRDSGLQLRLNGVSAELMHWLEVAGSDSVFQFDDGRDG
jgi:anti-anti-sigma factor